MNKRKLVTNREDYAMDFEDNYIVSASLSFTSTGHDDPQFPDVNWSLSFDATDVHMDVVLEQFQHMLNAMGYVTDGRRLELVQRD